MYLKLVIDDVVIGQSTGAQAYFTIAQLQGFHEVSGKNNSVKFPRSSMSKSVSWFQDIKVRTVSGNLKGATVESVIELRQKLASKIGKIKTVTVYQYGDGREVYKVYTFVARLTSFNSIAYSSDTNLQYTLSMESEDPNFYVINPEFPTQPIVITRNLAEAGMTFPIVFDVNFGNPDNTFEIINEGNVAIFPIYKLFGQGSRWYVVNNTTEQIFYYSDGISEGESVEINSATRRAVSNNLNKNAYCSGWQGLRLEPGGNSLSVFIEANASNASIEISYFTPFNVI